MNLSHHFRGCKDGNPVRRSRDNRLTTMPTETIGRTPDKLRLGTSALSSQPGSLLPSVF